MDDKHISEIATSWTMVRDASTPDHPRRQVAQQQLLDIYSDSIRRYLLASLKNQSAADEVYQNFALKMIRGDFGSADPKHGRFRHFVKKVIYHLVIDYHRSQGKDDRKQGLSEEPYDDRPSATSESDAEFKRLWREGLLNHAWSQLKAHQKQRGGIYYTVLRTRANHPDRNSTELLDLIESETGNRPEKSSLRVTIHRARQRFADYLLEAVIGSLDDARREKLEEELEQELIELDLKRYCADAMERRNKAP